MKKYLYLTLVWTCAAVAQEAEQLAHAPSMMPEAHNPFTSEPSLKPSILHETANPFNDTEKHEQLAPVFQHEHDTIPTAENHERILQEEHDSKQITDAQHPIFHEATEEKPTLQEERVSTATTNAHLPTIHMTPGHAHVFEPLINEGNSITGYFVTQEPYKQYLTHVEKKEGEKTVLTYTLTLPHTSTPETLTIFKGHDSLTSPKDLEPAFHIVIEAAPQKTKKALTPEEKAEQLKKAWEAQQQAEEEYSDEIQQAFETLRKKIRTIWHGVSEQNNNFEDITTVHTSTKLVTKEPLHLYVGQTDTIATGKGGSIQSSSPEVVSVKLAFIEKASPDAWHFSVTGVEDGKALVTYCVEGITYEQPVIVQKKIAQVDHENLQESTKEDNAIIEDKEHETALRAQALQQAKEAAVEDEQEHTQLPEIKPSLHQTEETSTQKHDVISLTEHEEYNHSALPEPLTDTYDEHMLGVHEQEHAHNDHTFENEDEDDYEDEEEDHVV